MALFIFGDSIVYGMWDTRGGWANRLKLYIDNRIIKNISTPFHSTYILGAPGNKTIDLLNRIDSELQNRINGNSSSSTIIISIGINDCRTTIQNQNENDLKNTFICNLKNIIKICQNYSKNIIFLGLTPAKDKNGVNLTSVKTYNQIIKKFAKDNNLLFINIYDQFLEKQRSDNLLLDGLHPNSEGHKLIFNLVKHFLIKRLLI